MITKSDITCQRVLHRPAYSKRTEMMIQATLHVEVTIPIPASATSDEWPAFRKDANNAVFHKVYGSVVEKQLAILAAHKKTMPKKAFDETLAVVKGMMNLE